MTKSEFKAVFSTRAGRGVFRNLLMEGHVFQTIDPTDTVSMAERNLAMRVLGKAGFFDAPFLNRMVDWFFAEYEPEETHRADGLDGTPDGTSGA